MNFCHPTFAPLWGLCLIPTCIASVGMAKTSILNEKSCVEDTIFFQYGFSKFAFPRKCKSELSELAYLVSALLFSTDGSAAVCCGTSSDGATPVADWGGVGTSSSAFFENIDVSDETWFVIPENMICNFYSILHLTKLQPNKSLEAHWAFSFHFELFSQNHTIEKFSFSLSSDYWFHFRFVFDKRIHVNLVCKRQSTISALVNFRSNRLRCN